MRYLPDGAANRRGTMGIARALRRVARRFAVPWCVMRQYAAHWFAARRIAAHWLAGRRLAVPWIAVQPGAGHCGTAQPIAAMRSVPRRWAVLWLAAAVAVAPVADLRAADGPSAEEATARSKPAYRTESLRGKVVWLAEAVQRRYDVRIDPDAAQSQVVLETVDGQLHPLLKEDRGRGFWKDPRMRGIEMELFVRRYDGSPFVQVIRVYTIKQGRKYEFDYWCDICAIPMFELKECECCQGPIRIRERDAGPLETPPQRDAAPTRPSP
jgi:hypothetical protein